MMKTYIYGSGWVFVQNWLVGYLPTENASSGFIIVSLNKLRQKYAETKYCTKNLTLKSRFGTIHYIK